MEAVLLPTCLEFGRVADAGDVQLAAIPCPPQASSQDECYQHELGQETDLHDLEARLGR
jgi:hypothetical protein